MTQCLASHRRLKEGNKNDKGETQFNVIAKSTIIVSLDEKVLSRVFACETPNEL